MTVPSKLYKYEPMSIRALQNLKSQIVYFGSPMDFNDPYDCAVLPQLITPDNAEVEMIRTNLLKKERSGTGKHSQLTSMSTNKLRDMLTKSAKKALQENIELIKNRGVACLSETNDNLLMWSHYSSSCKGFCLELSTKDPAFEKVRQVKYLTDLPSVQVSTVLFGNDKEDSDLITKFLATKAEAWAYEREWRSIHAKPGTKYGYKAHSLTGVFLGPDIDQESMEIICLILDGQNKHVQMWQGKRSDTEFRVEFKPVTYTSYIKAKQQGLL